MTEEPQAQETTEATRKTATDAVQSLPPNAVEAKKDIATAAVQPSQPRMQGSRRL
jgi:hypothetical protein